MLSAHPDVIVAATEAYEEYLERIAARPPSEKVRDIASRLLTAHQAARACGASLRREDVPISIARLAELTRSERALFLNQRALGLGRDDAPVVVIGTEHGYDLHLDANIPNFCLESCAGAIVWLCGGTPEIVAHLTDGAVTSSRDRPFHIYPNDHYAEGGGHTWAGLAKVLGTGHEHRPGAVPGLGDLCYQIDLSAYPSQRNVSGVPPSDERVEFLERYLRSMAAGAKVLLVHGRCGHEALRAARDRLVTGFLGVPAASVLRWVDLSESYRPLRYADYGDRRVVFTRALSGQGLTSHFIERLRAIVRFERPSTSAGDCVTAARSARTLGTGQPRPAGGLSAVLESDILREVSRHALGPLRENSAWRGVESRTRDRYVWWPKSSGRPIRCLHLGNFAVSTPITRPIQNGRVRHQLEFRGASRDAALAALRTAFDALAAP